MAPLEAEDKGGVLRNVLLKVQAMLCLKFPFEVGCVAADPFLSQLHVLPLFTPCFLH
jgi:hypothetical protein